MYGLTEEDLRRLRRDITISHQKLFLHTVIFFLSNTKSSFSSTALPEEVSKEIRQVYYRQNHRFPAVLLYQLSNFAISVFMGLWPGYPQGNYSAAYMLILEISMPNAALKQVFSKKCLDPYLPK